MGLVLNEFLTWIAEPGCVQRSEDRVMHHPRQRVRGLGRIMRLDPLSGLVLTDFYPAGLDGTGRVLVPSRFFWLYVLTLGILRVQSSLTFLYGFDRPFDRTPLLPSLFSGGWGFGQISRSVFLVLLWIAVSISGRAGI